MCNRSSPVGSTLPNVVDYVEDTTAGQTLCGGIGVACTNQYMTTQNGPIQSENIGQGYSFSTVGAMDSPNTFRYYHIRAHVITGWNR